MKNFILSLIMIIGLATAANAQTKPVAGDMGLGFKITGLADIAFNEWGEGAFSTPTMLYRAYLSDKLALRVGLGLDGGSQSGTFTDELETLPTVTQTDIDSTISNFTVALTPGIEIHLNSPVARIDPYIGAEIPFSYMGATNKEVNSDVRVTDLTNGQLVSQDKLTTNITTPGGLGVGLNAIIGFNFFFTDNFALGAEYNLGFGLTTMGGKYTQTVTGFNQSGTNYTPIDTSTEFDQTTSNLDFGLNSTGGVNISIFW